LHSIKSWLQESFCNSFLIVCHARFLVDKVSIVLRIKKCAKNAFSCLVLQSERSRVQNPVKEKNYSLFPSSFLPSFYMAQKCPKRSFLFSLEKVVFLKRSFMHFAFSLLKSYSISIQKKVQTFKTYFIHKFCSLITFVKQIYSIRTRDGRCSEAYIKCFSNEFITK